MRFTLKPLFADKYELVPLNELPRDQKTVAERKWRAPLKPKAEQKACDLGLFSDDSKQTELF
jgi:hypothetical protein